METKKIIKLNISNVYTGSIVLSEISSVYLQDNNISSFIVDHYVDATKSVKSGFNFIYEGAERFVTEINNIDFCEVIRKDINIINSSNTITYPQSIRDLPDGFEEVYKG